MMREHTGNEWQGFYPKTNLVSFFLNLHKINMCFIVTSCTVHTVGFRKQAIQIPKTLPTPYNLD